METHGDGGAREVSIRSGADELVIADGDSPAHRNSSPMLAATTPNTSEACAEVMDELGCTGAVQLSLDLPLASPEAG